MKDAWVVTPGGGGEPYRVRLVRRGDDVSAEVVRGEEEWTFALSPGSMPDRVWCGERSLEIDWRAGENGPGRLVLDGRVYGLTVESEAAHRAAALVGEASTARTTTEVRAPMPGLVMKIEVEEGAAVEAGHGLVIIEAMKMENEIVAPVSGVVSAIPVSEGETVEQGSVMIRIDPPEETE